AQELFDREGQECRGSSKLPHRERPHPVEQRGRRPWRPNGPSPRGDQQTQAYLLGRPAPRGRPPRISQSARSGGKLFSAKGISVRPARGNLCKPMTLCLGVAREKGLRAV